MSSLIPTTPVTFASGHQIRVLDHRAKQHDFANWEAPFITELMRTVEPGDTVYDVGAEEGEFSALVASARASVHMFEPTTSIWPNIKAVWDANGLTPAGCWCGFVADSCRLTGSMRGWPDAVNGALRTDSAFSFVDERPDFPSITLDHYGRCTGAKPDVIMLDVEGAEALVLRGATRALESVRALFVSVHPEAFFSKYNTKRADVFALASAAGFVGRLLGTDHEEHWVFTR